MDKERDSREHWDSPEMEQEINEIMAKRKKALWRYQVPESRSLEDALNTMTKAELDDIRYSLCVSGVSTLKKKELAHALVNEIVDFSKMWLPTVGIEQYNIITHLSRKDGLSTVLDMEDVRLDYMRSLGLIFTGMQNGEQAWYLPQELLEVYRSLNNDLYRKEIALNDEVVHLATGLLFYYGFMPHTELYEAVMQNMDNCKLSLNDFMGIIINASCWNRNLFQGEEGLFYYSVLHADALALSRTRYADQAYCQYSHDELYAAGEKDFILVNDESKTLVEILHQDINLSKEASLEVAAEVQTMLQNNEPVNEVFGFFQHNFTISDRDIAEKLLKCVETLRTVTPVWEYKGHTPAMMEGGVKKEFQMQTTRDNVIKFVPRSSKIGRNDPCPCGSGKKYKKCCMDK